MNNVKNIDEMQKNKQKLIMRKVKYILPPLNTNNEIEQQQQRQYQQDNNTPKCVSACEYQ